MSKIATLLSSNAALVGGGAAATAVAVIALVASGVLTDPKEPTPAAQEPTVTASETAVATPAIADAANAADDPEMTPRPEGQDTPAEEVAVAEPEATVEPTAEPATPEPVILPAFDLVRIAPDGAGQIAGTATPNAQIVLLLDGVKIAMSETDGAGKFFTFITLEPNPQPSEILLVERRADGDLVSESAFLVAPIAAPVVVAEAEQPTAEPEAIAPVEDAPKESATAENTATAQDVEDPVAEVTAEAAQPETPQAPAVLVSDADGVRVVQPATVSDAPELTSAVSIDAISYSDSGAVVVAGRGLANGFVRLYLDNTPVETSPVDETGQWQAELQAIDAGLYTLRVDEVDASGKVLSRVETPFKRETPKRVAEARQLAQTSEEQQADSAKPAASTPQATAEVATSVPVAKAESEPATPEPAAGEENAALQKGVAAQAETAPEQPTPAPTQAPKVAEAPRQPAVQIITVQPGSSLWAIARDRYGEGPMYVRVFEANKDKIRDPDLIYPGQVFTIPE